MSAQRAAIGLVISVFTVGCAGPPRAPKELEELASFLFDKTRDGSDEELAAGLENLDAWLADNYAEASEGYEVRQLSKSAVDRLDDRSFNIDGLQGAAVATRIAHKLRPTVDALVVGDAVDIYGNTYEAYRRDWDTNPDCHLSRNDDCLLAEASIASTADYGLAVVESRYRSEYRWVDTELGWAHIQRTWLLEPVEILGVTTNVSFYVAVTLPGGSRTERLQASWAAVTTDLPISDDAALNTTLKNLIKYDEQLDEWLD